MRSLGGFAFSLIDLSFSQSLSCAGSAVNPEEGVGGKSGLRLRRDCCETAFFRVAACGRGESVRSVRSGDASLSTVGVLVLNNLRSLLRPERGPEQGGVGNAVSKAEYEKDRVEEAVELERSRGVSD